MSNQYCLTWLDSHDAHYFLEFESAEEVRDEILNLLSVSKVEQDRIRIYRRPGMTVEEFLPHRGKDIVDCPHCHFPMHQKFHSTGEGTTHIYTCDECPNIMFEYSDFHNILDIASYLKESDTLQTYYQRKSSPATELVQEKIPYSGDWVQLAADAAIECSLNGVINEENEFEYVVEICGNTEYFYDYHKAAEYYVRQSQKRIIELRKENAS